MQWKEEFLQYRSSFSATQFLQRVWSESGDSVEIAEPTELFTANDCVTIIWGHQGQERVYNLLMCCSHMWNYSQSREINSSQKDQIRRETHCDTDNLILTTWTLWVPE